MTLWSEYCEHGLTVCEPCAYDKGYTAGNAAAKADLATWPQHYHKAKYDKQTLTRQCDECGRDLLHPVHIRSGEPGPVNSSDDGEG